jgi:hypothetical protein
VEDSVSISIRQAAVLGWCLCTLPLGAQEDPTYFPLAAGNRWTYIGKGRLAEGARFEIRVKSRAGDLAVVSIDPVPLCYYDAPGEYTVEDRGGELDIEIPGEGYVPYYRFAESSFTHHDMCSCDNDRMLTAAKAREDVETDAGVFTGCLRFDYGVEGTCFDAGKTTEWWAPGIGLVQWEEQSFAGPVQFVLESYQLGGDLSFERGDSNQDGNVDLSDPIDTLGYLFLGAAAPACRDAADADDNGTLEITDPIATLEFLFLGAEPLPAPGPTTCGIDPTSDTLDCAEAACQ